MAEKKIQRRVISDVKDYIRIDDFYSELGTRDEYIRVKKTRQEMSCIS
jgi:hypothetical protein